MPLPSSLEPMRRCIEELLTEGEGGTGRTIPAGEFTLEGYFDGRADEGLSRDVLHRKQAMVALGALEPVYPNDVGNLFQYRVEVFVSLAYSLPPDLDANQRRTVESLMLTDVHTVRKALSNPTALATTKDGGETGLASGRLEFLGSQSPDLDYQDGLGTIELRFFGDIFLG